MNKRCIILFTKDRPNTLSRTLSCLGGINIRIFVVDDSTRTDTYELISNKYNQEYIAYHGGREQIELLSNFKGADLKSFLKPLGQRDWNLGFVRNYALILAWALGYEEILFIDDDIVIHDAQLIESMFSHLKSNDFVGARVVGMPDHSVVGHLMKACGGYVDEFISGGFLAFNMKSVSEYFLNLYNEDQIWLFLHAPHTKFAVFGEVEQQQYNPFKDIPVKAVSQEFGEILDDGAEEAFRLSNHSLLLSPDFWREICKDRLKYFNELSKLAIGKSVESTALCVCQALINYHARLSYNDFVQVFKEYHERREIWEGILGREITITE